MPSVRIEFVTLNAGQGETKNHGNLVRETFATARLTTSTTATASASRPAAPAQFGSYSRGHARITACGAPVVVVIGTDPTASDAASNGIRIGDSMTEALPIRANEKLSFIVVE